MTPAARHGRHRCSRCRIGSKGATGGQHRQTRGEEAATTVVMTKRRACIGGVEHRLRRLLARWNTGIPCMWFRRKEAHCRSWTRGGLSSSWGSAVIRQSSSNTPSPLSCRSYSASSLGAAPQSDRGSPAPAPLAGSSAAGSREARRRQIEGGPPLPDGAPPPRGPTAPWRVAVPPPHHRRRAPQRPIHHVGVRRRPSGRLGRERGMRAREETGKGAP